MRNGHKKLLRQRHTHRHLLGTGTGAPWSPSHAKEMHSNTDMHSCSTFQFLFTHTWERTFHLFYSIRGPTETHNCKSWTATTRCRISASWLSHINTQTHSHKHTHTFVHQRGKDNGQVENAVHWGCRWCAKGEWRESTTPLVFDKDIWLMEYTDAQPETKSTPLFHFLASSPCDALVKLKGKVGDHVSLLSRLRTA